MLDYGCGSGILAIGAAKFGARDIDAVDIDEAAVASTRLNAEANGVTLNAGLPELAQGRYRTVLANILANPLRQLASPMTRHLAPHAHVILSGLLTHQAPAVIAAYRARGLVPLRHLRIEGWSSLLLRKVT